MKRLLALLLTVVMICALLPMAAFADADEQGNTVDSMTLTGLPSVCVIGDSVSAFKPGTLQGANRDCSYFWYIEKYGEEIQPVAVYIAEEKAELALSVLPELSAEDIISSRVSFGDTFESGYDYRLVCVQVLADGYTYASGKLQVKAMLADGTVFADNSVSVSPSARSHSVRVWLKSVSVKTPAAPNLTVSTSAGKVKLSWNAVAGADKYQVCRSTDGSSFKRITTVSSTSYTNTSVACGTRYYYKVRAVNTVGEDSYYSKYSDVKNAVVPMSTPKVTAAISEGNVILTIQAVSGTDAYKVFRSTDGKSFSFLADATRTTYKDKDVTAGTTYYYKVKATKTVDGKLIAGDPSEVCSVKVLKAPKPTITSTDSTVKLSWKAVSGAEKYKIYRGAKGCAYKYYTTVTKTSYTNTKVECGRTYFYKIESVDANGGTGAFCKPVSIKPIAQPVLKGVLNEGVVKLSWAKVKGATGYELYRSADGVNYKLYDSVSKSKLSYDCKSLTEGKTYSFKLVALGAEGVHSADSKVVSLTVLSAPKLKTAISDGAVKLSWNKVTDAAKYEVYRSTDNKSFKLLTTATGSSFTNTSVTGGTKYYYKVRALNADGGTGKYSYIKAAVPLATPKLTASLSAGTVKLSWKAITGADKYELYRSVDGESFTLYDTVSKTSYTSSSVKADNSYFYKVRAVKVIGDTSYEGSFSKVKSVAVVGTPALTASVENGEIVLSWSEITGAAAYELYRSTDKKTFELLTTADEAGCTDTGAVNGTKYYYRVRALNADGGTGKYSYIKAAVVLETPVLSGEVAEDGTVVMVSWNKVKGATGYELYVSENGGEFTLLDTAAGTSYKHDAVAPGSSYTYKLVAVKDDGSTVWASEASEPVSFEIP